MSRDTPLVGSVLRALGWCGLAMLLITMFLSDFLAHAPAGVGLPGAELTPPSEAHPFGTDMLGRDVLSETLHGLTQTGRLAVFAAVIAIVLGGVFGAVAARLPKPLALTLRGIFGVLVTIPPLLLAIVIVGLTGHGFVALAAGFGAAPLGFVRAFDHVDLDSAHTDYARATGIPGATLLRRDLTYDFRNVLGTVVARALAAVIIIVSTASFLGFGAEPPARDLGLIIAAAKINHFTAWWTAVFPGIALILFILCARLAAGLDEGERA
jgi:peptide/nickel transport system permease protein